MLKPKRCLATFIGQGTLIVRHTIPVRTQQFAILDLLLRVLAHREGGRREAWTLGQQRGQTSCAMSPMLTRSRRVGPRSTNSGSVTWLALKASSLPQPRCLSMHRRLNCTWMHSLLVLSRSVIIAPLPCSAIRSEVRLTRLACSM